MTERNAQNLTARFDQIVSSTRGELGDLDQQARNFARERPVVALLCAIGLGYVVARVSSHI